MTTTEMLTGDSEAEALREREAESELDASAPGRPDANAMALRAIRSILDAANDFEFDVRGKTVEVKARRLDPVPWPRVVEGLDETRDGPWPTPVELRCTWEGGGTVLTIRADSWYKSKTHGDSCGVKMKDSRQELLWTTVPATLKKAEDGTDAPVRAFVSVFRKREPLGRDSDAASRSLVQLVTDAGIPLVTAKWAEAFRIRLPSAEVLPSPAEAFRRLVTIALLKQPFLSKDYQGKPILDPMFVAKLADDLVSGESSPESPDSAGVVELTPDLISRWKSRFAEAQRDTSWLDSVRRFETKRRNALPGLRERVAAFIDGKLSLQELADTLSNEWKSYDLHGKARSRFVSKLIKYLPDQDEVTKLIREVVAVPASDEQARVQLQRVFVALERALAVGVATPQALQANLAGFFLSICWHIQDPERWPVMYCSTRRALRQDGLYDPQLTGADRYLVFAQACRNVSEQAEIPAVEFEHLCVRIVGHETSDDDDEENSVSVRPATKQRVWLISPGRGADLFDRYYREGIVGIGWNHLGDLSAYDNVDQLRDAIQEHRDDGSRPVHAGWACYQFAHEMRVGDLVFAKRGRKKIVGYGTIESVYRYDAEREPFHHIRAVKWLGRGEWDVGDTSLVMKTLTDISGYPDFVAGLRNLVGLEEVEPPEHDEEEPHAEPYTLDDALRELFLPRADIEEVLELLRYKKNLVLQGPPGVGKTFFAQQLSYLLLGEVDSDRIHQVQFHQSYAYEDFIQGYRPTEKGEFARADGPFMRFCELALQDPTSDYVLLIDEINRGNLSKIFGELLMLIEADKRDAKWGVALTYSRKSEANFHVPPNVHIIGTMNTADRSLALVDYALRRRFAFFDVRPGFNQPAFAEHVTGLGASSALSAKIIDRLEALNRRIRDDANLGEGFCIGHSYFCHKGGQAADDAWYRRIVRTEIAPQLREYWFDNGERADEAVTELLRD